MNNSEPGALLFAGMNKEKKTWKKIKVNFCVFAPHFIVISTA
jgi:hypothetical protein